MNAQPEAIGAAHEARYEYHSDWLLDAPVERVWHALVEVESWPDWWPYVRRVQTLRTGDRGGEHEGLGAIRRIVWGSRLPYGFTLDVEAVESLRHRRLAGRATGGLEGLGVWELEPQGAATRVRYTWRLALNTRWMKIAAPLMAPVFRWNHEGVMHGGAVGLARHLGGRLLRG
jgi:uncharacterized protein YndB with AHSA1/START domain